MVRCRFKVFSKTQSEFNTQCSEPTVVKLQPVTGEPFEKWTPAGNIELFLRNDEARKQFVVGKEYFVDFSQVE